jgi:hypothetical protein
MYRNHNGKGQLASGLIMITLGLLFLLDHLNVMEFSQAVQRFWPLILIWIGVSKLIWRQRFSNRLRDEQ